MSWSSKRTNYPNFTDLEDCNKGGWDPKRFEDNWCHLQSLPHFTAGGKRYKIVKNVQAKSLKAGTLVLAKYNSTNFGVQLYQIFGVTNCIHCYGEMETPENISFKSVKEAMQKYNATTLESLKDNQHECIRQSGVTDTYGHDSHLYVKDVVDGTQGPWFYIFENRWCRGSGAEPLSFVLVEEFPLTNEEQEVQRGEQIKEILDRSYVPVFMKVE